MHKFILKNPVILLLISAFLIFFSNAPATAQDKMEVAGKISATITEGHNFDVGDMEGHIFHISKSEGINTSTGKNSMMDGALVVNNNFSDLVKGTGHHQGFILMNKDGNSTVAKWEGNVSTTLSGNVPLIKFEGTFTYVSGTGKYANIKGGGKYKGMYISANTYVVDWDGEYSIKK